MVAEFISSTEITPGKEGGSRTVIKPYFYCCLLKQVFQADVSMLMYTKPPRQPVSAAIIVYSLGPDYQCLHSPFLSKAL